LAKVKRVVKSFIFSNSAAMVLLYAQREAWNGGKAQTLEAVTT